MEIEQVSWESTEDINPKSRERTLSAIELERLVRKMESSPLSEPGTNRSREPNRRTALEPREQLDLWFTKRDQMRTEIKRGWELLEQVQRELAVLHARLDEWPGYELVCGKNPLPDYMQAIAAKERIEQYLPAWLKRREEQLDALDRQMEHCARQNGIT